ncbi:uncharacterized protein CELE_K03B8.11 [Caenorhabditis elegans]|uniref:Secreted protein n=1 Tax=Caenorhabditis elegans TaxID=6239 RepID=Q7YWZ1_CAEEL|nr:Secreted protein [Caenorhabditis elegans]CAE17859.1 Secreted protein [Caenorhabditis elegans]|eukprot:NP_001024027.1 Uncharacterized protein CELE_K03B8.11 [Caenorhabditis elegans]
MKLVSLLLLFTIFLSGLTLRLEEDLSAVYIDHGEIIVEDKPDLPGSVLSPEGNPPTHVTYQDVGEATTKRIYH